MISSSISEPQHQADLLMTIAFAVASNDGIVLASDSASMTREENGRTFIFHHKRKIFPLHDTLPVAVVAAGLNRLAGMNVSNLCLELGNKLTHDLKWKLDPKSYTVRQVVDRLQEFIFADHYLPLFERLPADNRMTFYVGGYSAGESFPEVIEIAFAGQHVIGPARVKAKNSVHVKFTGVADATQRLMQGFASKLPKILEQAEIPQEKIKAILRSAARELFPPILHPDQPLGETVEVVRFLAETEMKFSRFSPEPDTVGGALQLATLSLHDGFRWLERGHRQKH